MFGNVRATTSSTMPVGLANSLNVAPTMEEHKAEALRQLRALRSYDVDTLKKQEIVKDLVSKGFDVNDPIDDSGYHKIRLLDMAFKEMDEDFARFLVVNYHANPKLCVEAAWFAGSMVAVFDGLPASTAVADPHACGAASPEPGAVPEVIIQYNASLRLAEDALTTWQSAPGSFSSFATLITRIDNLMHRFVDYLAATPKEDWPTLIHVEYMVQYAKFDGYIVLEFALREKIADALRSGNKELALLYCAIIKEMIPRMKNYARYNLLRGIKMDGGRGHALSIFGTWWASNYQKLCHEDPAFYTEFKAMKVRLRDSLNWMTPSPRLQSANILQAIDRYQQLCQGNGGLKKRVKAYAELLALIPEKDRTLLINNQYPGWRGSSSSMGMSLVYGLREAMHHEDKELALSYIEIAKIAAHDLKNEDRFVLRYCITPGRDTEHYVQGRIFPYGNKVSMELCKDPAFNAKFNAMNAQLTTLLGNWMPPEPTYEQSAGNGP